MKVLVVVADAFHLGYLGCYGNDWVATPTLDGLAAEGVVFDRHYADCPDAAGARRAWRTGRYSFPVPGQGTEEPIGGANDLIQLIRAEGIVASLILDGGPGRPEFARGWENVHRINPARPGKSSPEKLAAAVAAALDRLASAPRWLFWVDLGALVPPWNVPEELIGRYMGARDADEEEEEPPAPLTDPSAGLLDDADEDTFFRLQCTYAAAVTYLDQIVGLLFDELRHRGLFEDTLIVVTTDRGIVLGEHGITGECRPWLHEELVHLPLIVRFPGGTGAGSRVSALTQSVDLMPTLLDAFGLRAANVHGHSLLPLIRDEALIGPGAGAKMDRSLRDYACSGLRAGGGVEWAMRTREWAFLLPVQQATGDAPRPVQLYVKPDDRWEVNNVLQHYLELAERLEHTLRVFVAAVGQPGPLQLPELRLEEPVARERETPETSPVEAKGTSHEHGQAGR